MMRVKVQWDFSEFLDEELVDDQSEEVLNAAGYSFNDIDTDNDVLMQQIHNDIARHFNIPVKLDINIDQEDLTDGTITIDELVSDYLSERFGWCVESWEEIEA